MLAHHLCDNLRQDIRSEARRAAYQECRGRQPLEIPRDLDGLLQGVERAVSRHEEGCGPRRRLQPAMDTMEQLEPKFILKPRNEMAHCRLRLLEESRRGAHRTVLINNSEGFQMACVHSSSTGGMPFNRVRKPNLLR
jgi:hypothetical protein